MQSQSNKLGFQHKKFVETKFSLVHCIIKCFLYPIELTKCFTDKSGVPGTYDVFSYIWLSTLHGLCHLNPTTYFIFR